MAKRTTNERDSERLDEELQRALEEIEDEDRVEVKEVPVKEYVPKTVLIQSLRDGIVNIRGTVTGQMYKFVGAGSTVKVDELDAPAILAKRSGKSCCGPGYTPYFSLRP